MKRFIAFVIFCISVLSCTKVEMPDENNLSKIHFSVNVVEGTSFTKSVENSVVISEIRKMYPAYYYLRLTNLNTNNIYEVRSDETTYLPCGTYRVENYIKSSDTIENIGKHNLRKTQDCPDDNENTKVSDTCGNAGFCIYPRIIIDQTIEVTCDSTIGLEGVISCQAFVYENEYVENVFYNVYGDWWKIRCVNVCDKFSFFFCENIICPQSVAFDLKCVAKENKGVETTTYRIESNPAVGGLAYGKFYILKCNEVENYNVGGNVIVSDFGLGDSL